MGGEGPKSQNVADRRHLCMAPPPSVCGGGEDKKLESSEAAAEGDALFEAHTDLLSARSLGGAMGGSIE